MTKNNIISRSHPDVMYCTSEICKEKMFIAMARKHEEEKKLKNGDNLEC